MDYEEEEGVPIDWENPFDEIRSSEIDEIQLEFVDGGMKFLKEDDKGNTYTQYKWKCIRMDITTPSEVSFITSSSKLIKALQKNGSPAGKTFDITRSGQGFQTQYTAVEV